MSCVFDEIAVCPGKKKKLYSGWSDEHRGRVSLCKKETTRGIATVYVAAFKSSARYQRSADSVQGSQSVCFALQLRRG